MNDNIKIGDVLWAMHGRERNGMCKFFACPKCVEYVDEHKFLFGDGCGGSLNSIGHNYFLTRQEAIDHHLEKYKSLEVDLSDDEEFESKVTHEERTDFQDYEICEFDSIDCATVYMGGMDRLVKANDMLEWHEQEAEWAYMTIKTLTLSEIYEQLKDKMEDRMITVFVESPLHGEIFQCGNHEEGKWEKYGSTQGYA